MLDLLRELDAGTGALPRGSEVVLLNAHPEERVAGHLEQVRGGSGLRSIRLRHVRANPLTHEGVSQARRRPPNPRLPYSCPAPCRASWGTPCCRQVVCPPPPKAPLPLSTPASAAMEAAGWQALAPAWPQTWCSSRPGSARLSHRVVRRTLRARPPPRPAAASARRWTCAG